VAGADADEIQKKTRGSNSFAGANWATGQQVDNACSEWIAGTMGPAAHNRSSVPSQRRCWPFAPAFLRPHGRVDGPPRPKHRRFPIRSSSPGGETSLPWKFDPDLVVKVSRMIPGSGGASRPEADMLPHRSRSRIIKSLWCRASSSTTSSLPLRYFLAHMNLPPAFNPPQQFRRRAPHFRTEIQQRGLAA
jgi:hypothetical protein